MKEFTLKFPNLPEHGTKKIVEQYKPYIRTPVKDPTTSDEFKLKFKKLLQVLQAPQKKNPQLPRRSRNSSLLCPSEQIKLTPNTSISTLKQNDMKKMNSLPSEAPTNCSSLNSSIVGTKKSVGNVENNSKNRQKSGYWPARYLPVNFGSAEIQSKFDRNEGMEKILKKIEESDKINFRLELIYSTNKKHKVIKMMRTKFDESWDWKSYGSMSPEKKVRFKDLE